MTAQPTVQDKQITIDVPEDRVAEFYSFYGHFLAGSLRPRGRGRGHRCGGRHQADAAPTPSGGETQQA